MSTNQRKHHGEADDSGEAQERSRLLAPSTGGASEPEPVDLGKSGTLSFELAGEEFMGVTSYSPESEDINLTVSDSGSVVQWEQNQQHPLVPRAADNSAVLLASDDDVEARDSDGVWSSGTLSSPDWMDEYTELIEGCEEQRSQLLLDSSVLSDDDEDETIDVSVTDSASEEGDSSDDDTESSDAWPAGTIRCPICMDFYPQIVQSKRLILSTLCGHVFCSQCLPFALQTARFCPTCRTELTPGQYHPIYI